VNKIDRAGARYEDLLASITAKLAPSIIAMGQVSGLGDRTASEVPFGPGDADFVTALIDRLTIQDDGLLATYLDDDTPRCRSIGCVGRSRTRPGARSSTRSSSVPQSPAQAWIR
jgi:hypothetical protein